MVQSSPQGAGPNRWLWFVIVAVGLTGLVVWLIDRYPGTLDSRNAMINLTRYGAILVLVSSVFLLAVLPGLLSAVGLGTAGRVLLGILRFPVMILLMAVALSILYFLAPNRGKGHRFRWLTAGGVVATVLWILLSGLLSIYTSNFSGSRSA